MREPPISDNGALPPGTVVAGKYRIEKLVATGGMGAVMAAKHELLGQRVALKVLLPAVSSEPQVAERFLREARAAARLTSDYVARVFDVGRLSTGQAFMVMEYLEGTDLSVVQERGPVPVQQAVDYVLQALDGLAEAHAAGIVHRDLKPSNLVVTKRADGTERVKLIDFGISKLQKDADVPSDRASTNTFVVLGSPGYMSPEQILSSKSVDARSDLWSIGVILHELIAGKFLFDGSSTMEVWSRVQTAPISPLRPHAPEVSAGLDEVIGHCLERDPNKRCGSARELMRALLPFASSRMRAAFESVLAAAPVVIVPESGALGTATTEPPITSSSDKVDVFDVSFEEAELPAAHKPDATDAKPPRRLTPEEERALTTPSADLEQPSSAAASAAGTRADTASVWTDRTFEAPGKRQTKLIALIAGGAALAVLAWQLVPPTSPAPTPSSATPASSSATASIASAQNHPELPRTASTTSSASPSQAIETSAPSHSSPASAPTPERTATPAARSSADAARPVSSAGNASAAPGVLSADLGTRD